jgi:hypothetical protein
MADENGNAELFKMLGLIEERTRQTADDVDALKHVLLEGNGSPALTVQVADLNGRVKAVEENRKAKTAIKVAVIGGLVGIVTAIIQLL